MELGFLRSHRHSGQELSEPFRIFQEWFADAQEKEPNNSEAMALASVDEEGFPDVRMVLLKAFDERGFVFFTNLESRKGHQILSCKKVALCFYWKSLRRQIRVRGEALLVTKEEADLYFSSRSRKSRIAAWASRQSQVLKNPLALEKAFAKYTLKFLHSPIPKPDYWSGFRIVPSEMEFWCEREFRLHKRILFKKSDHSWIRTALYP